MADNSAQIAALQKQLADNSAAQNTLSGGGAERQSADINYTHQNDALNAQIEQLQNQDSAAAAAEANRNAQDKAEDAQVAAAGDFVGYDKSGNAVYNKNGQYSAFNPTDFSRTINNLKADPANASKSYESYAGQQQFKSLGDYQGIDKETGSAVFNQNGQNSGFSSKDFGDLNDYIKSQNLNKQWLNPDYEKQFNAATAAGTTFSGYDSSGNQIEKDALGHYQKVGDPDSGFSKFAKYNLADQKFTGPQGVTNATAGENANVAAPVAGQQRAIAANAQSNEAQRMPFQNRGGSYSKFAAANPQDTTQTSQSTSAPPPASPTPVKEQATPAEAPPTPTASTILSGGVNKAVAKNSSPAAPTPLSNVFNQPSMFDTAKATATNYAQGQASGAVQNATGLSAQAISNPAAYARQQALQQASSVAQNQAAALGVDTSALGDTSKILSNPANYVQQQAAAAIAKQYGFDPSAISNPEQYAKNLAAQQASDALGFNPMNALNNPAAFAQNQVKQMAMDKLSEQIGFPITAQALQDPIGFAKKAGLDATKTAALNAAADQFGESSLTNAAGDTIPYGSAASGALNVGGTLLHGGLNENSSNAAGQAAARAALSAYSMGLANPELFQAGAGLTDSLGNKMGTAGVLLKPTSAGLTLGSGLMNTGINAAGNAGAADYAAGKQGLGGLKQMTKGDVLGGATTMGKALANFGYGSLVKAPVSIAKNVVSNVSAAVKNLFCFDGETKILMADDTYKKIKNIKIGEKVALGGTVTGIGEGYSQDLYDYNGVEVSGGHAVFENGVWKRVKNSDDAENLHIKKEVIVFPMATENHLIVTKGQVWSDLTETEDNYNKTEDARLAELNGQKRVNRMLKLYVANKFVSEK